tara:strand:- start:2342 stop:3016 length:675 start_codon:yes stop_codon:yes gene_type:complete
MKNILMCSYRDWSNSICERIEKKFKTDDIIFTTCNTNKKFLYLTSIIKYDIIFFIGWSSIIEESIIKSNICICLHPSLLPKYRGGSPIQHQIINGEDESGVTLFIMDEGIDTGPIIFQKKFNIKDCNLEKVFDSIIDIGFLGCSNLILNFIEGKPFSSIPQNNSDSSFFNRRTKYMSEICIEDFSHYSSKQLYDKIRSLQDPYPNAFIRCKDDTILYLTHSRYE